MGAHRHLFVALALLASALALVLPAPLPATGAATGRTTLLSLPTDGVLPTGYPRSYASGWSSGWPTISADGHAVAFSTNLNLVPEDTNGLVDVYIYDRSDPLRPQFLLASPGYDGQAAGLDTTVPVIPSAISADGSVVVFASSSRRLDQGDQDGVSDVYAYSATLRRLVRVSRGLGGAAPDGPSLYPAVSGDGAQVVYASGAGNLVAGDTNGASDIFVSTIVWGATPVVYDPRRVSVAVDGSQMDGPSNLPAIARDGATVAYCTRLGGPTAPYDIMLTHLDVVANDPLPSLQTIRLTYGNGDSLKPAISSNGNLVAFKSAASNLVPGDQNGLWDIFTVDSDGAQITRESLDQQGQEANGHSGDGRAATGGPTLSGDGRYLVFPSSASDLVADDGNGFSDLFVRDRAARQTRRISVGSGGAQASGSSSGMAAVSDGGGLAVFSSQAGNLSAFDTVAALDVFLHDPSAPNTPPTATIDLLSPTSAPAGTATQITLHGSASTPEGYIRAYAWRSSIDGLLSQREDVSLPIGQLSVGAHTITLHVLDSRGMAAVSAPASLRVLPAADQVTTLIVENVEQLARVFPYDKTVANVRPMLQQLAAATGGAIVSVEADAAARAAYAAWNAPGGNTTANANAVAAAVRALIAGQRAQLPQLRFLVLVGDDRVIPFYRTMDPLADEVDYAPEVEPSGNLQTTVGRALYDNQLLTDDYYASPGAARPPFVPELATGRLVETPMDILFQLDYFLAATGPRAVSTALGSSYDMAPGWQDRLCATLGNDGLVTDCSLMEDFTYGDFVGRVLNTSHDLVLLRGHAAHYAHALPDQYGIFAADIQRGTADLRGALVYDEGCHTGLNVPPLALNPSDLSQAFAQRRAPYIGSTGYAPFSRNVVAFADLLMLDFAEEIVAGQATSVGEALLRAKLAYINQDADGLDGPDQKALAEFALFGLPMFAYTTPGGAMAQVASTPLSAAYAVADLGGGLTVNRAAYQFPPLDLVQTADGAYYTLGGQSAAADGKPVQPKYVADFTFPGTAAHGVVFRGGSYQDLRPFDPVVAQALNYGEVGQEPAVAGDAWLPSLPARLNTLTGVATMATVLGQYHPASQTERLYDQLSVDVYYHPTSGDWAPPTLTAPRGTAGAGQARLDVQASDPSGIAAVVVAYTDGGGSWASVELAPHGDGWSGTIPAGAATRFFVQAVDGAGNVAALDNAGRYFALADLRPGQSLVYLPRVIR